MQHEPTIMDPNVVIAFLREVTSASNSMAEDSSGLKARLPSLEKGRLYYKN